MKFDTDERKAREENAGDEDENRNGPGCCDTNCGGGGCCGAVETEPVRECCCCGGEIESRFTVFLLGAVFLGTAGMMVAEYGFHAVLPGPWRISTMLALYLPAAWPVWKQSWKLIREGDFFNEFSLMSLATIGAFVIGEYIEGIAVMLFYRIGEMVQEKALVKARSSIRKLLDVRPQNATVLRGGAGMVVPAADIARGEEILVAAGERVALDGKLLNDEAEFNAACLTGESTPVLKTQGETVFAGMINLERPARVRTSSTYADTMLSRILHLVNEAAERKSKIQGLISRLARVYTPIVVAVAVLVAFLPALWDPQYRVTVWGYRALFFLVLSCPCALLISIPLGYFGGIGLAARHGILLKGANFLDALCRIEVVALDKTGTLTHGRFEVAAVYPAEFDRETVRTYAAALERHSRHPIARAVAGGVSPVPEAVGLREVPGHGVAGQVDGREVKVGRLSWFDGAPDGNPEEAGYSLVGVSIDGRYAGTIAVTDTVKDDAAALIDGLKAQRIKPVLLSGDRTPVAAKLAAELGIEDARAELLPQDKLAALQKLQASGRCVAAVGDGINDAPLLAAADVGIAMGTLGSDAAIEVADVVIQDDRPSKLLAAMRIGRMTRRIVWENIALALLIKAGVLVLGMFGLAGLWAAVFADVGVALLAVANAVRLQYGKVRIRGGL